MVVNNNGVSTTAVFWYLALNSDMYDSYQELQYGDDTLIKSYIQTQIQGGAETIRQFKFSAMPTSV